MTKSRCETSDPVAHASGARQNPTRRELLGGSAAALSGWLLSPALLGSARPAAATAPSGSSPPSARTDRLANEVLSRSPTCQ